MSIQQSQALTATIQELGYESVDVFALEKAKEALQAEIDLYQKEIERYEQKYAMSFKEFIDKFDSIIEFGLFEKEDDQMEWNAYITAIGLVKEKLIALID